MKPKDEALKAYESSIAAALRNYPLFKFKKGDSKTVRKMFDSGISAKDAAGLLFIRS